MHAIPLYFQPMLTLGDQRDQPDAAAGASPDVTPQIVFMLFTEIPGNAGEVPFSSLAAAAKAWALRDSPAIKTNPEFLPALLTFEKLAAFLADAADPFEFTILPGSALTRSDARLAPFPMLPWLKLTPPAPGAAIDFATRRACSADFLDKITDPFAVPKPREATASPAPASAPKRFFPSLAAAMFTDYFVTVIRHLLDDDSGDAGAAAQAAGLFLMHGVRLPDPASPTVRDYPLYVLSGQQLALPADLSSGYTVNLEASGDGVNPKVTISNADGKFPFANIAEQLATLLGTASLAAPFDPGDRVLALTQSEPFAVVKKRFALSAPVLWNQAGQSTARRIYALPFLLRDQLAAAPLPASLDLSLIQGTPEPVAATGYAWATRVNFTIRQIADPSTPGRTLPTIYEIAGMDIDSRDDLLTLLNSQEASGGLFEIALLYSLDAGAKDQGLQSDAVAAGEVWIVKSNLSTEAHATPDAATSSADMPEARPDGTNSSAAAAYALKAETFLKLLWESSLVATGGFHLFYGDGTGLPASLFGQTGTAVLSLTIMPQPRIAMQLYHNCVVWGGDGTSGNVAVFIDPPVYTVALGDTFATVAGKLNAAVEKLFFANATDCCLVAKGTLLPPSSAMKEYAVQEYDDLLSLALRYERQPLGTGTLDELWTTLHAALPDESLRTGASLQIHPGWVTARPTIAPGSFGFRAVAKQVVANQPAGGLQKLYSFLGVEVQVGSSELSGSLPASPQTTRRGATGVNPFYRQILYLAGAAASDPYGRTGETGTLALQYQDVFGNRCLPASKAPTLAFQLGYRDALLGVSQWPGTSVSFDFASGRQIVFTLSFETSRYIPASGLSLETAQARAKSDLERYNRTAFQIGQKGVSILVQTSLAAAPVESSELLSACRKHVEAVRACLKSVQALTKVTSGVTQSSLAGVAAEHPGVKVEDLAAVNQDLPNLLAIPGGLVIPALYAVNRNETLAGIAPRHNTSVEALAAGNKDAKNLFAAGTQLQIGGTTVQAQVGDTLASIAGAGNVTVAQLATAIQNAALQAGTVIKTGETLYNLRPADTLGSVAREQRVSVALLATANQDRAILNTVDASVQLEIPVPPALQGFTPIAATSVTVTPTIASTVTPVSVSIVIARPADSVDKLFADVSQFADIQSIEAEIRPAAETLKDRAALRTFAKNFETAFSPFQLTLALGPDHAGTKQATTAKRFYAVRFQDVKPQFGIPNQARYYAPAPLLNTGWSGSITAGGASVNFVNVDLDAWAREFVTTLDLLLSPPYSAGLHAAGKSVTYHSLASSKATIAAAMRAAVAPVFQSTQASASDLAAAQDLLYQRVLVQLQEFYRVDAIVQFTVTTAYTGDAEAGKVAARLSGSLQGSLVSPSSPGAKPDFTLSDAAIDLQQTVGELTFAVHLASSSHLPDLKLMLQFHPRAIDLESAFQGAALAPGYKALDQLVLLPSSDISSDPFATIDIPVPLRAYPVPPALIKQEVVQSLPDHPTLADLKTFEYRFRFSYTKAGQDQLQVHLTTLPAPAVADPDATGSLPANAVDRLPEALAAWTVSAARLKTDLAGLLASAPDQVAKDGATTFATLAETIAGAWSTRTPQLAQSPAQVLSEGIMVTQDNLESPDENLVTVSSISPPDPLNVIAVQSVLGSLHVTRNRVLAGSDVNTAFVYQVPTVQFTNPVVPLFREDNPIDIMALPERPFVTTQDPLRKQVATLFANLLDATTATPKDNLPNVRIAVAFEWALATASGAGAVVPALVTRLPVALLPRVAFDPSIDFLDDQGLCARIAQELLSWHASTAPPAGTWVFDVSLYSAVGGDSIQPLLELTNLRAAAEV